MVIIKICTSSKCWGEFKEKVGMEIDIATMENTREVPLKTRIKTTYDPAIETLGKYTEKRRIEKTPVSNVIAALLPIDMTWKQSRLQLTDDWIVKLW